MKKNLIDKLVAEWQHERPDLDPTPMYVVGRLIILGKSLEKRASSVLKESSDIFYTDLDVLATIRRSGVPYELTPKELMKSVLITSGAMTALLDRLTKLNLIYRAPDESDGRIKKAGLTLKGKKVIDNAIKIRFDDAKDSISMLNTEEKKILSNLLQKMMDANNTQ